MNSKYGVQSKRKHKSHDSCLCITGFSACGCQKKSVVYETECRHVAVQKGKLYSTIQPTPHSSLYDTDLAATRLNFAPSPPFCGAWGALMFIKSGRSGFVVASGHHAALQC